MKKIKVDKPQTSGVTVINDKKAKPLVTEEEMLTANQPIRAVVYVEVYDMSSAHVQHLLANINEAYKPLKGGIHYIIPIRHGKIVTDILFEQEILDMINQLCEIKDNHIVFKENAKEVKIIREKVE